MTEKIKKITVSYIKSPSKWGTALFQQVTELLEAFSLQKCIEDNIHYEFEITDLVQQFAESKKPVSLADCQMAALQACVYADIVIFDGSLEDDKYSQYYFAYDLMKNLDHVLIVSRTELPYNLKVYDTETNPAQINTYILQWIKDTLHHLELPRSNKLTEPLSLTNILPTTIQIMKKSDERMEVLKKSALFISYLSRDFEILKNHFSQIEEQTGLSREGFRYFAPGKVAKEFMTEQRRWEIVSITDREIDKCGALLIFETEGYYRSWWTMGELISVAYRFRDNWEKCPTVYVAKASASSTGLPNFTWQKLETPEQKRTFFPTLSEQQFSQIARRFVNSDPNRASYELDEKTMKESDSPSIIKMPRAITKGIALYLMERTDEYNKFLSEKDSGEKRSLLDNIHDAIDSEYSYTHTKGFRTLRIAECKYCRDNASNLTVNNFIQLDMPYAYRVDDKELVKNDDNSWSIPQKCPIHGTIPLKQNGYYFRFIQPRGGKIMGSKKTIVERIDRLDFCDI